MLFSAIGLASAIACRTNDGESLVIVIQRFLLLPKTVVDDADVVQRSRLAGMVARSSGDVKSLIDSRRAPSVAGPWRSENCRSNCSA